MRLVRVFVCVWFKVIVVNWRSSPLCGNTLSVLVVWLSQFVLVPEVPPHWPFTSPIQIKLAGTVRSSRRCSRRRARHLVNDVVRVRDEFRMAPVLRITCRGAATFHGNHVA